MKDYSKIPLSVSIRKILVPVMVSTLAVVMIILYMLVWTYFKENTFNLLDTSIKETIDGMKDYVLVQNTEFMDKAVKAFKSASDIQYEQFGLWTFDKYGQVYSVVGNDDIIVASSKPEREGYDLGNDERFDEIIRTVKETGRYIPDQEEVISDKNIKTVYFAGEFEDGSGYLLCEIDRAYYIDIVEGAMYAQVNYRNVGTDSGYIIICDSKGDVILSYGDDHIDSHIDTDLLKEMTEAYSRGTYVESVLFGENSYCVARENHGNYILAVYLQSTEKFMKWVLYIAILITACLVFVTAYFSLSLIMDRYMMKNVDGINRSLQKIEEGRLDERVNERGALEFSRLSDDLNSTVERIDEYIKQEAERIDKELEMAGTIQKSSLPNVFPPYPEHKDFGLYASMNAAKVVGGDFYDFFFLKDNLIAILMADVSDKGIPAAMFMMRAKTRIKALALTGIPVDEVISRTSDELYADVQGDMFITLWIGFFNLTTGKVEYVHAGHTCPVLVRDGSVSFIKQKKQLMVAGMPVFKYKCQEYQLEPGDAVFLYTDGVTEALDKDLVLYGNDRLTDIAAKADTIIETEDPNEYAKMFCEAVLEDVVDFVSGADQSDDITMLCFKYIGNKE